MAAEQRIFRRVSVLVLVAVLCATGLWTTESQADPLRLMLSRRADSLTAGQDVFLLTYDTFDDLIASPASGSANGAFSSINISDNYIASGLTYDGKYQLMLSRRADSLTAGQDVFLLTYDTFDDLIASPASGSANGAFSSINISDNYIATGLAFEFENVASVSEPRSSDLVLVALALLCWTSMTKRSRRVARPRFVC